MSVFQFLFFIPEKYYAIYELYPSLCFFMFVFLYFFTGIQNNLDTSAEQMSRVMGIIVDALSTETTPILHKICQHISSRKVNKSMHDCKKFRLSKIWVEL